MLRKLREFVEGGVVLITPKPEYSPSLSDGPDAANEVKTIADQMWGSGDTAEGHAVGKGKVYSRARSRTFCRLKACVRT